MIREPGARKSGRIVPLGQRPYTGEQEIGDKSPRKLSEASPRSGQGTLEMTAALILVMMLIVGAVRIFVWLNERMLRSQIDYEQGRVEAGSKDYGPIADITNQEQTRGIEIDVSNYTALNIFK